MIRKPRLTIVKAGQAISQARHDGRDFEHWFASKLGAEQFQFRIVRIDHGELLPPLETQNHASAILVTGSPALVSERREWSEACAHWLQDAHAAGLPILGVCYGHQLLARALGGSVGPNPRGPRMGGVRVEFGDPAEPLTGSFSPATVFNVCHTEAVLEPPAEAHIIGRAPHDPFHALYFGNRSWGVQFHPEFDSSIMRTYIEARATSLQAEGQDPIALAGDLVDSPAGSTLLARFADIARTTSLN